MGARFVLIQHFASSESVAFSVTFGLPDPVKAKQREYGYDELHAVGFDASRWMEQGLAPVDAQ